MARDSSQTAQDRFTECSLCNAQQFSFYADADQVSLRSITALRQDTRAIRPRTPLHWANKDSTEVMVLKSGWAFSFQLLEDGGRQILDIYMDGDTIGMPLMLEESLPYGVHTITDCRICVFDSHQLRDLALAHTGWELALWKKCMAERLTCYERIVDLGRRSAMERFCRFIVSIRDRATARGKGSPFEVEFPLRQHHMADFLGLTAVHTGRLVAELSDQSVIRIKNRRLAILDEPTLMQLAGFPTHRAN